MTKDEALRLALEALEDRTSLMKWQLARDAVKEALEQPEQEPLEYWNEVEGWVKREFIRDFAPPPPQEKNT